MKIMHALGLLAGILFIAGTVHAATPNSIYILADDMGQGDVSCYNPNGKIQTPHIDRPADLGRWGLWFDEEAGSDWARTLLIGNGRLGGAVYGNVARDEIQLNEDTIWAGGPNRHVKTGMPKQLKAARAALWAGDRAAAEAICEKAFLGTHKGMAYQTVGSLFLEFDGQDAFSNYTRQLDLDTAVVTTRYTVDDVNYTREYFSSPVDQMILIRIRADQKGKISFEASMDSPMEISVKATADHELTLYGKNSTQEKVPGQVKYECRMQIHAEGGQVAKAGADRIAVKGADSVVIRLAAASNFVNYKEVSGNPAERNASVLARAQDRSYERMLADHLIEHQRLFRRSSIDLGRTEASNRPTDERAAAFAAGKDPDFAALIYQLGRYLLISSSRPGSQPANLQGLWNDKLKSNWDSKYTTNINLEMNYWLAEVTGLPEVAQPLFELIKGVSVAGREAASEMYDARGWTVHHNTDQWCCTAVIDNAKWGQWPTGGVWLTLHLWEHYLFSGDRDFLREVYPVLKGAAEFALDYVTKDPATGWLVTGPTISPEHGYCDPGSTEDQRICKGTAMDTQLLTDVWSHTAEAAEILGRDRPFQDELRAAVKRLPPHQIGSRGELMEWLEDVKPPTGHRHISHLYAVYPSDLITVEKTPKLAEAAKRSLVERGESDTGWSMAWKACVWARLKEGGKVYRELELALDPAMLQPNALNHHVKERRIYQIDATLGCTAAMAEMLMQSHLNFIEFLPALPAEFPAGSVSGLRARGGFEVNISWENGAMKAGVIKSLNGSTCSVKGAFVVTDEQGAKVSLVQEAGLTRFETVVGKTYGLKVLKQAGK